MPCKIIDGKKAAEKTLEHVRSYISEHKIKPRLATILVGDDPASETYVNIKKKTCESVGISAEIHRLEPDQEKISELISKLNHDRDINGILVQLPIPNINVQRIIEKIDPSKDVDGLHPLNLGRLSYGDETIPACTPMGIIRILEEEKISLGGARICIIGRGIHVGKPLHSLLCNRDATVTLCHSKTRNIEQITRSSDIVIVAVGKQGYLKADMIKEGAVVIDVGINRIGKKLIGDVADEVRGKASALTPVPGGVGPMTVAMLVQNTLNAYIRQRVNK